MGTIRLPTGDRITGVPDIRPGEDFTPTLEEFFWASVIPPNPYLIYMDKSGERSTYFATNMTIAAISAWFAQGESLAALRWMKAGQAIASPAGLITMAATGYVATHEQHGGATGMLVGDMNMGMPVYGPMQAGSSLQSAQNPAGWDFSSWWTRLF